MGVPDPDDALDPAGDVDDLVVQAIIASQFHRSPWFERVGQGRFEVGLPEARRLIVGRMVADLRELLLVGGDALARLYPTPYPEDEEHNAEFAAIEHDQLLMARLEALDVVERTLEAEVLTTAELTAWMQVINEARLVLGTSLDVTEDDPRDEDPDDPDAASLALFRALGGIIGDIVDALHADLVADGPDSRDLEDDLDLDDEGPST